MSQPVQCDATDTSGARCTLQSGHSGQHAITTTAASRPTTSFGRILATPLALLVAAFLVGMVIPGSMVPALLVAAIVGIVYILVASRR